MAYQQKDGRNDRVKCRTHPFQVNSKSLVYNRGDARASVVGKAITNAAPHINNENALNQPRLLI